MSTIKLSQYKAFQYFDIAYLLKFLLLFGGIYGFNLAYSSLSSPYGNYYIPFLDNYLNYIGWLKDSILYASNVIAHIMGINSYILPPSMLAAVHGIRLIVGEGCLGLGVSSFWIAFILADGSNWKRKLAWCLGGLLSIWLINCFRVAFMLLAYEKHWHLVITSDYHFAFNVIAYTLVFVQIFIYNKMAGKKDKG